jgi:hypothetical protein
LVPRLLHSLTVPGQGEVLDEDNNLKLGLEVDEEGDNCYLSISQIVEAVVKGTDLMGPASGMEMTAKSIAENTDEVELERELELAEILMNTSERGRGKRKRKLNSLYASHAFWHHYDEDTSQAGSEVEC